MRWIVASLLVMNISAFIYFWLFSGAESAPAAALADKRLADNLSITLLSEKVDVEPVAQPVPEPPAQPQVAPPVCTLVGSFKTLLKAEYFAEALLALGLRAEVKRVAVESDSGYWLYLPPEASRKEALRRLSELQARGVDSYVIPSGNLVNGISLGMFSRRERAEIMLERIKRQGYRPQIVAVPRKVQEIWVFLGQGEAAKLSDKRWLELLSSADYIQKRQNLCADLASA